MHPFGTCRVAGAMTVISGGRAAQSGHRARLGRLMRFRELTRGLATPPGRWPHPVAEVRMSWWRAGLRSARRR